MLYNLLLIVILSSPSELLKNASKSNRQYDFVIAQQYLDSAKGLSMTDFEESQFFENQGYIFQNENRLPEALLNFHEALRYLKASGEKSDDARYRLMAVNNNIGWIYFYYSNHQLALKYYEESLKHAIDEEKAEIFYNIGLSQSLLGQTQDATTSFLEGFELALAHNQSLIKANILTKIGTMFYESDSLEASLEYLGNVLKIDSLPTNTVANAHNNYAITSWKMGDFATAKHHFEKTIALGDSSYQFAGYQNLCEMYLDQGYLDLSIAAGMKAEDLISSRITNPNNLKLYSYLAKAYEKLSNYPKALSYANLLNTQMLEYYEAETSSIETDDAYRIRMITENYELKLEQLKEREISIMINIAVSTTILMTLLILVWRQQNKKKKMIQEITEELLA